MRISGVLSDFYSIHNPIVIDIDRIDFLITSVADNGSGFTLFTVDTSLVTVPTMPYGSKISVVDLSTGKVQVFNATFETSNTILTDEPYVSGAVTGTVLNLTEYRAGYYLRIDAYVENGAGWDLLVSTRNHTSAAGKALIDIGPLMRNSLQMKDEIISAFTDSLVNSYACKKFKFDLFEVWIGNTPTINSSYTIAGVNAAQQANNKFFVPSVPAWNQPGAGMAQYTPETTGQDLALFLSPARKLRYFQQLPFDISFLYPFQFEALTKFKRVEEYLDKGGNVLTSLKKDLLFGAGYGNKVHRTGIFGNEIGTPGYSYPIDSFNIFLEADDIQVSEKINVRLETCTSSSPLYLKAFNRFSGWSYFLFRVKQVRSLNVAAGSKFRKWVTDISLQTSDVEYLYKNSQPELKIGADLLDQYDMQIIEEILSSAKVFMLTNPKTWAIDVGGGNIEGQQWEGITVRPGSFETLTTNRKTQSIEFNIELIPINTPEQ